MIRISCMMMVSACALLLCGCPSKPKGTTTKKARVALTSSKNITPITAKKQPGDGYTTQPTIDISTIEGSWRYPANPQDRLCLVQYWPKQGRLIVTHTKQPCEVARVQAGRFDLIDASTKDVKATFEGYLHHTEDGQFALILKDKDPAILSIKDGRILPLKTTRQATHPRAKRRILLDAKTHTLWTFERTGEEQETIYMRALKIDALKQTQSIDKKAFFWPNPSPDRYKTVGKQLYVAPTEKIAGERCALALYHIGGQSTCVQSQQQEGRHLWRPEYALTLDAKHKTLRLDTYQKQPIANPLPKCKVDRLRTNIGQGSPSKDYALVQCKDSKQTHLWRPDKTRTIKLPGDAKQWHMLSSMPNAQHNYRLINLNTKQQMVLNADTEQLWLLPDQLRLRTNTLAVEKPTATNPRWSVWSTKTLPNLALVAKVRCEGKLNLLPTATPSQTVMVCIKKDARSCQTRAQLWATRIDEKAKTLTPLKGGLPTDMLWAIDAYQNGPNLRCPAKALVAP